MENIVTYSLDNSQDWILVSKSNNDVLLSQTDEILENESNSHDKHDSPLLNDSINLLTLPSSEESDISVITESDAEEFGPSIKIHELNSNENQICGLLQIYQPRDDFTKYGIKFNVILVLGFLIFVLLVALLLSLSFTYTNVGKNQQLPDAKPLYCAKEVAKLEEILNQINENNLKVLETLIAQKQMYTNINHFSPNLNLYKINNYEYFFKNNEELQRTKLVLLELLRIFNNSLTINDSFKLEIDLLQNNIVCLTEFHKSITELIMDKENIYKFSDIKYFQVASNELQYTFQSVLLELSKSLFENFKATRHKLDYTKSNLYKTLHNLKDVQVSEALSLFPKFCKALEKDYKLTNPQPEGLCLKKENVKIWENKIVPCTQKEGSNKFLNENIILTNLCKNSSKQSFQENLTLENKIVNEMENKVKEKVSFNITDKGSKNNRHLYDINKNDHNTVKRGNLLPKDIKLDNEFSQYKTSKKIFNGANNRKENKSREKQKKNEKVTKIIPKYNSKEVIQGEWQFRRSNARERYRYKYTDSYNIDKNSNWYFERANSRLIARKNTFNGKLSGSCSKCSPKYPKYTKNCRTSSNHYRCY
ncbi:uncharacterized protein [Prorops nasuta]|uniref:uncharacterized protein isoform X2 n=1 Tax=Prorops nasuta TaxID=863751 RepID=UPI0034CD7196